MRMLFWRATTALREAKTNSASRDRFDGEAAQVGAYKKHANERPRRRTQQYVAIFEDLFKFNLHGSVAVGKRCWQTQTGSTN